jgi:hypothetical protein
MKDTILPLPNGDFTTLEHIEKHGPLTITCMKIRMGDVEDPDLMVAAPIYDWQQTEMGKWIMANAIPESPSWHRNIDASSFGWVYSIRADLTPKNYTYWWLKWGHELDAMTNR